MITLFRREWWAAVLLVLAASAHADRIKDLASVEGVRVNQLIGYGLVVGLDGTGDQTTQTPFTVQSLESMLTRLGINVPPGTSLQLKNVAAVTVTADLPPFAVPGQQIDVTVSSIGNAGSLSGGTLLMTPLKGLDGKVYAIAQGNVSIGGAGASAGGSSVQINHLSAGRIPDGATVERALPIVLGQGPYVNLDLANADFTTAARIVQAINQAMGNGTAQAMDSRLIQVRAPDDPNARVAFVSRLENLSVDPGEAAPKVILNARTGSIVMNEAVTVDDCAIAHGNLSVVINTQPVISQPTPFSKGRTVVAQQSQISVTTEKGHLIVVPTSTSLDSIVRALNAVGATPQDLLSILQAMKAAGALHADLEII
ncbi:MAG: flagellar basal body P-ring protein FlgI [Betaproteobacteria bacterium]|nr:flagellar basal body P-ring protein FlgI [Betaproteobacteria bacterium]